MRSQVLPICFVLFACGAASADTAEFPAEKFRKALEQSKELEVSNQPLGQAIETLARQTNLPLQLDPGLQSAGVFSLSAPTLTVRPIRQTVAAVLDRELAPHGLTYVVLADKVLITTTERAAHLAVRQKVRVDLKAVPLADALARLARETGVNIVVDPEVDKASEIKLTLRFADVTLEVAVRMLAASAGLHSVRLDNALFVTKTSKAQVLSADAADLRTPLPPASSPLFVPGGMLGLAGGGMLGQLGGGGLGGGFGALGALGVGGGGGALGGGQFGIGGALGTGGGALGQPPQKPPPTKPPTQPPKKAPDVEKKQGAAAGPAQGKASSPRGVLVTVQDPVPLTEAPARGVKAAPAPAVGKPNGNRNFKALLDVLTIPRDARGNPTSFDEQGDPSLTLGRVLQALQDKFSRPGDTPPFYLLFDLDRKAFEAEGANKPPEDLGLGIEKAKIPAERNISLLAYLRKILLRVEGAPASGLTFVIGWDNRIEITTNRRLLKEVYGKRSKAELKGPLPPLIHAVFEAKPLDEALRELSEATDGYNVLINGNLKEAKVPVTATFRNIPLDTAVWTLTDMAGLTVVRKDNLLYVTSREAAAPPQNTTPAKSPKKAPDVEKKQGAGAGPAQGKASSPRGVLVAARGAAFLAETPTRNVKAAPAPDGGTGAGNRNLKALLDALNIPRDGMGNPTSFDEQGDPSLTLDPILKMLQDKFSRPGDKPPFHLIFDLDRRAFEADGVAKDPRNLGLGIDKSRIPAEKNLSLSAYLRKIFDRVEEGPASGLTFVIGGDYRVIITTNAWIKQQHFAKRTKAELKRPLPPLVHTVIEAKPLKEALRELSDASDNFNVVIKPDLKEAETPVTVTFRNVPLDTAVWTLAEMAGLTVVRKDNLLYVTSKEAAVSRKPPMKEKQ